MKYTVALSALSVLLFATTPTFAEHADSQGGTQLSEKRAEAPVMKRYTYGAFNQFIDLYNRTTEKPQLPLEDAIWRGECLERKEWGATPEEQLANASNASTPIALIAKVQRDPRAEISPDSTGILPKPTGLYPDKLILGLSYGLDGPKAAKSMIKVNAKDFGQLDMVSFQNAARVVTLDGEAYYIKQAQNTKTGEPILILSLPTFHSRKMGGVCILYDRTPNDPGYKIEGVEKSLLTLLTTPATSVAQEAEAAKKKQAEQIAKNDASLRDYMAHASQQVNYPVGVGSVGLDADGNYLVNLGPNYIPITSGNPRLLIDTTKYSPQMIQTFKDWVVNRYHPFVGHP